MRKLLYLLLVVVFILSGPSISSAKQVSDQNAADWVSANKVELIKSFTELGISPKTQEKLLDKLSKGQMIDSTKPNSIKEATEKLKKLGLNETETIIYPDGSVAKIGNEEIQNDEMLYALSTSTEHTINSYWISGVVNIEFTTDFVTRIGDYDYIVRSYNEAASVIGGTITSETLTIGRKYETQDYRAYSEYRIIYSLLGGWAGGTFDLFFHVGSNTYETKLDLDDKK
ncbi:hypothetical protein RZN22_06190 [Bacillaceae bacterium S4-13-58]